MTDKKIFMVITYYENQTAPIRYIKGIYHTMSEALSLQKQICGENGKIIFGNNAMCDGSGHLVCYIKEANMGINSNVIL